MNMCQCLQCKALNRAIESCDEQLKLIQSGNFPKPTPIPSEENWNQFLEERYSYLENLREKLKFIVKYPERKMVV